MAHAHFHGRAAMPRFAARLAITFLAALVAWPSSAVVLRRASFRDLVLEAGGIYVGQVVARNSAWTASPREIVTRYRIRVDRTLKGFPVAELELTELGGIVEDQGMVVPGVPEYAAGERVVIFVHAERGRLMTLRFFQGKFAVVEERRGDPRVVTGDSPVPVPLEVFANRVAAVLAGPPGGGP